MGSVDHGSMAETSWDDAYSELDENVRSAPIGNSEEEIRRYQVLIEESNRLAKSARSTKAVLQDSELVLSLTKSIRESAKTISAPDTNFDPEVFARGIVARVLKGGNVEDWNDVAEKTRNIFRYAPRFKYIVGSNFREQPNEVIEKKTGQKRERQARKILEARKEPEKVVTVQRTDEGVAAVTGTLRLLVEEYKANSGKPICFFKFVINPNSFSKTIENIFHLSFLARDGKVDMSLDKQQLPVLTPILESGSKSGNSGQDGVKKVQALISLTKDEWAEIIREFQITRSVIP